MPNKEPRNMAECLLPLNMNRLRGRMLRIPPPKNKKREILFVYGHHTSLERIFGVAEYLSQYGGVTAPDLPGFGGMEPFYKIGEKPTLDNMADYLASFVKLRYRNRRFTVAGYSLGFMVVTRMLQKYPEIAKKVDLVISVAGFTDKADFRFKKRNYYLLLAGSWLGSTWFMSRVIKLFFLRGPVLRLFYRIGEAVSFNAKVADMNEQNRQGRIAFEIFLWKCNEFRTYASMAVTMFRLDLAGSRIDLPVTHVSVDNDHYFNNVHVEEHMRAIYNDFKLMRAEAEIHSPSVIGTAEEAAPFIPRPLRQILSKNP